MNIIMGRGGGRRRTSLLFLSGRTGTLQDFELNEVEGHEAEGEARHNTGEQNEETGKASVKEPPRSGKRNIIGLHQRNLIMAVGEEDSGGQC